MIFRDVSGVLYRAFHFKIVYLFIYMGSFALKYHYIIQHISNWRINNE